MESLSDILYIGEILGFFFLVVLLVGACNKLGVRNE